MTAWPDLVIGLIAIYFGYRGFRAGLISELAGAVAVFVAVIAAFQYRGSLDDVVMQFTHLSTGSAHIVGTIVFAVVVYALFMLASYLLGRVAAIPAFAPFNRILGAVVGAAKALVGACIVLYFVLLFPLPADVRGDLHHSALVRLVTQPDAQIDRTVRAMMPWFVRPLADQFFARHRGYSGAGLPAPSLPNFDPSALMHAGDSLR